MRPIKLLFLALLCFTLTAGCGDDTPPMCTTITAAAITSPLVGTWYSATGPSAMSQVQVRASIATADGNFSAVISAVDAPDQPLYVITGTVDPDGRHFNDAIVVNGTPRHCFAFATADGSRMFIGIRDDDGNYLLTWVFLRTQ